MVNPWENPQANVVKPTENPMTITLGEASRQTGKTKSTILKAIKTGRLSAAKGETGDWQIDPAELFRVYAPTSSPENAPALEVNALAVEIGIMRERCSQLETQLADVRQDREHWRQQATALLADHRQQEQPEPKGWRGFLHRLTG
jgi:hypothetical protein